MKHHKHGEHVSVWKWWRNDIHCALLKSQPVIIGCSCNRWEDMALKRSDHIDCCRNQDVFRFSTIYICWWEQIPLEMPLANLIHVNGSDLSSHMYISRTPIVQQSIIHSREYSTCEAFFTVSLILFHILQVIWRLSRYYLWSNTPVAVPRSISRTLTEPPTVRK